MPVNPDLMAALRKEYGPAKGRGIYFAMENKGHPATKAPAIRKALEKPKRAHARTLRKD